MVQLNILFVVAFLILPIVLCQRGRGFRCRTRNGQPGECVNAELCEDVQPFWGGFRPRICGYEGFEELYCCAVPQREKFVSSKSIQKCEEYKSLWSERSSFERDDFHNNFWRFGAFNAIVSGEASTPTEFPHMAALGFGTVDDIQWLCGGSLISKNFILTAAHCLSSQDQGVIKFIRLGDTDLQRNDDDASPQQFTVKRTIEHPEYKENLRYHDIGLVELDRPADFTRYARPACLHTTKDMPSNSLVATGWGSSDYGEPRAGFLQKVTLRYQPFQKCSLIYNRERWLDNGLVDDWQFCAGDQFGRRDTCQGDSGGPLQIKKRDSPLYTIVGIISFGKLCGLVPGVYTRVSNYVPWIESVVWTD